MTSLYSDQRSSTGAAKRLRARVATILVTVTALSLSAPAEALGQDAQGYLEPREPRRLALVVGNADYQKFEDLPGSLADSQSMAKILRGLGFDVDLVENARSFNEFVHLNLVPFADKIEEGDLVVFYFSGHGFAFGQTNYLVPTNAPATVTSAQLNSSYLPESAIRAFLADRKPGVLMTLLDSCRTYAGIVSDRPDLGVSKGLQPPANLDSDVVIGFAAAPGQSAYGLQEGQTSHYTSALISHFQKAGWELGRVRREVTYYVRERTGNAQQPWFSDSLASEVFLNPTPENKKEFLDTWQAVLAEGRRAAVQKYLAFNRVGPYAQAARKWLSDHPEDARITYTQVSPLLPELAWAQASGNSVRLPRFPANLGVARTLDLSRKNGLVGASAQVAAAQPTLSSLLEIQGEAILLSDSSASRAGTAIEIPRGTSLNVLEVGANRMRAMQRDGGQTSAALFVNTHAALEAIAVGKPLVEISVGHSPSGSRSSVDVASLQANIRHVDPTRVGWVSIATPEVSSPREQGLLSLQALHAKKVLKDSGIAESKISTVEALPFSGSVLRVRIYGF